MPQVEFAIADIPWWRIALYLFLGPFVIGNLCSWVRRNRAWADGYTRKLHHIAIMALAFPLLAVLPDRQLLPAVMIASVGMIGIYALASYSQRPLIHGMAAHSLRERDAPHSRFFFLMPMVTVNLALLAGALLFPLDFLRVAFFTVAIADGLAEPVGLRFGKGNRYRIPDPIWGRANTKSLAGSSAVFLLSFVVAYAMLVARDAPPPALASSCLIYAAAVTVVEACSPRGLDNMLLVLAGPLVLMGLLPW